MHNDLDTHTTIALADVVRGLKCALFAGVYMFSMFAPVLLSL